MVAAITAGRAISTTCAATSASPLTACDNGSLSLCSASKTITGVVVRLRPARYVRRLWRRWTAARSLSIAAAETVVRSRLRSHDASPLTARASTARSCVLQRKQTITTGRAIQATTCTASASPLTARPPAARSLSLCSGKTITAGRRRLRPAQPHVAAWRHVRQRLAH